MEGPVAGRGEIGNVFCKTRKLKVFENRVLRRIFEPKRDKVTRD